MLSLTIGRERERVAENCAEVRLADPTGSWVKDLMKQLVSGPTTTLFWRGSFLIDHLHIESEK